MSYANRLSTGILVSVDLPLGETLGEAEIETQDEVVRIVAPQSDLKVMLASEQNGLVEFNQSQVYAYAYKYTAPFVDTQGRPLTRDDDHWTIEEQTDLELEGQLYDEWVNQRALAESYSDGVDLD